MVISSVQQRCVIRVLRPRLLHFEVSGFFNFAVQFGLECQKFLLFLAETGRLGLLCKGFTRTDPTCKNCENGMQGNKAY